MNPIISIVIPAYNAGLSLEKCLNSLLKQSYSNLQIIIVNDGSTDSTDVVSNKYKNLDSRVKYIYQSNGGGGVARNTGINHADGEYLCFVDADDYVGPYFVEKLYEQLVKGEADLAICGFIELDGNIVLNKTTGTEHVFNQAEAMKALLSEDSFKGYVWNKMFRMNLIKQYSLQFDTTLAVWEDVLFVFQYLMYSKIISYDPSPTYYYIFWNSSISHQQNHLLGVEKSYAAIRAKDQIANLVPESYQDVRKQLSLRYLMSSLAVIRNIGYMSMGNSCQQYKRCVKLVRKHYWSVRMDLSKKDTILSLLTICVPALLLRIYRINSK